MPELPSRNALTWCQDTLHRHAGEEAAIPSLPGLTEMLYGRGREQKHVDGPWVLTDPVLAAAP